jgi:hypothetical protein
VSAQTEKAFDNFAVWFENNLNRYPIIDQEKRWQFLIKVVQNQALVIAKLVEDVQALEGRGSRLYLPSGLQYTGDLTKVG